MLLLLSTSEETLPCMLCIRRGKHLQFQQSVPGLQCNDYDTGDSNNPYGRNTEFPVLLPHAMEQARHVQHARA